MNPPQHEPNHGSNHSSFSRSLPPQSVDASPRSVDELTILAHELSNMLDGSMRWLLLADQTLGTDHSQEAGVAREQIDRVHSTLERMSGLVDSAMKSGSTSIGSPLLDSGISLGEAIDHAVDVVRPRGGALGIGVQVRIEPEAGRVPAGPLYSVILNGLTNAIDAIERVAGEAAPGGLISISVQLRVRPGCEPSVELEITDDGCGLAATGHPDRLFAHGVSNHPGGHGVGLALARRIIQSMRGQISLDARPDRAGSPRPGAQLLVRVPAPVLPNTEIGRKAG